MKTLLFFNVLATFIFLISSLNNVSKSINRGASGRYCVHGTMDLNSTSNDVDMNHYCGVHMIDVRACVSITYQWNTVTMGCDNDDGFPEEPHSGSDCYMNDYNHWICYCNGDHCNDCTTKKPSCFFPVTPTTQPPTTSTEYDPITTTTTTTTTSTPPTTITHSNDIHFAQVFLELHFLYNIFFFLDINCFLIILKSEKVFSL